MACCCCRRQFYVSGQLSSLQRWVGPNDWVVVDFVFCSEKNASMLSSWAAKALCRIYVCSWVWIGDGYENYESFFLGPDDLPEICSELTCCPEAPLWREFRWAKILWNGVGVSPPLCLSDSWWVSCSRMVPNYVVGATLILGGLFVYSAVCDFFRPIVSFMPKKQSVSLSSSFRKPIMSWIFSSVAGFAFCALWARASLPVRKRAGLSGHSSSPIPSAYSTSKGM